MFSLVPVRPAWWPNKRSDEVDSGSGASLSPVNCHRFSVERSCDKPLRMCVPKLRVHDHGKLNVSRTIHGVNVKVMTTQEDSDPPR